MSTTGIRKISMSKRMADELREYAWRNRTNVSEVLRGIVADIAHNPAVFDDYPDTKERFDATATFVATDEQWLPAKDIAYFARRPLSSLVRRGVTARLSAGQEAA